MFSLSAFGTADLASEDLCTSRLQQQALGAYGYLESQVPDKWWFDPVVDYQGIQVRLRKLKELKLITKGTFALLAGRPYLRNHWQYLNHFVSKSGDWAEATDNKDLFRATGPRFTFPAQGTRVSRATHWDFPKKGMRFRIQIHNVEEFISVWGVLREAVKIHWERNYAPLRAQFEIDQNGGMTTHQIIIHLPESDSSISFVSTLIQVIEHPTDAVLFKEDRLFDTQGSWFGTEKLSTLAERHQLLTWRHTSRKRFHFPLHGDRLNALDINPME